MFVKLSWFLMGLTVCFAGNCTQTDVEILHNFNSTFHSILQTCATKSLGDASKTASCLSNKTGLGGPCSICFGYDAQCSRDHCAKYCMLDPTSTNCLNCVKRYCYKPLLYCTGLPPSDIPP